MPRDTAQEQGYFCCSNFLYLLPSQNSWLKWLKCRNSDFMPIPEASSATKQQLISQSARIQSNSNKRYNCYNRTKAHGTLAHPTHFWPCLHTGDNTATQDSYPLGVARDTTNMLKKLVTWLVVRHVFKLRALCSHLRPFLRAAPRGPRRTTHCLGTPCPLH